MCILFAAHSSFGRSRKKPMIAPPPSNLQGRESASRHFLSPDEHKAPAGENIAQQAERCGCITLMTGRHGGGARLPVQSWQPVHSGQSTCCTSQALSPSLSLFLSPSSCPSLPFPSTGLVGTGRAEGPTMDPTEAGGSEKEKEKEKEKVIKKRNRPVFLRYLERRKTDTIVADDAAKGDFNLGTLVRRSQSDKTEYSAKLKGTPDNDLPWGQNYGNNLHTREPTLSLKSLSTLDNTLSVDYRWTLSAECMAWRQKINTTGTHTHTYTHTHTV